MNFPKHQIALESKNKLLQELHQKRIGFSPFVFCEFFQGMNVLQVYGHNSGEYTFGLYDSAGNYIGHVYFGTKYDQVEIARICVQYMPPNYNQVFEYIKNNEDATYMKFDNSSYAFVLEKVLKKIE